MNGSNLVNEAD